MSAIVNRVIGKKIASFEFTQNPKLFYFTDESIEKAELTVYSHGIEFSANTRLSKRFYDKDEIISTVYREKKGYIQFDNGEELILGITGEGPASIGGSCTANEELTKRVVELVNELKSGLILHEAEVVVVENIRRWRAIKFSAIFTLVVAAWFSVISIGYITTNLTVSFLLGLPALALASSYIRIHYSYSTTRTLPEIWCTVYWVIFIFVGIVILFMFILQWVFGIIL